MLRVEGLHAWYGESHVLHGVDLEVPAGEIVTLVGRNGMGKTTTLRCIMGLHAAKQGRILLDGRDITRLAPQQIARLGVGWVQDDRGIYSRLTVLEHLRLPPVVGPAGQPWSLERIFETFPILKERAAAPGSKLSGGEQQILAVARVLRMGARLLLMDEPTEGLAPILVRRVAEILDDIKAHGLTVLLVEQNLRFATMVADRHYLIVNGRTVNTLSNREAARQEQELLAYLGV
ncbi:MAG TPA: ABC transporter ATP-binding protein [bacterium]|nr:ABC transporter ATP-binding protein [bacterium]